MAKSEINASVMESLLRRSIAVSIPSDGQTLVKCLNSGELLVLTNPQHPISQGATRCERPSHPQAVGPPSKHTAPPADEQT